MRQRLLPDETWRCSAYWYCWQAGLLTGHWESDLEFMRELGWHAAGLARSHRIPPWGCNEGPAENPYWVHMWPEIVWSTTVDAMAARAAEHGDMCPDWSTPRPGGHGSRDDVPWDGDDIRLY